MKSDPPVLIVEDLECWQAIMREALEAGGYQTETVASYTQALQALARQTFRAVVIDPSLDDANRHNRDGLRVLEYILTEYPTLPVLVVTSSDPAAFRRETGALAPNIPLLWKDEWDDDRFLALIHQLTAAGSAVH